LTGLAPSEFSHGVATLLLLRGDCHSCMVWLEKSGINPDCDLKFQRYNLCSSKNDH
jgi:hypothetical protein